MPELGASGLKVADSAYRLRDLGTGVFYILCSCWKITYAVFNSDFFICKLRDLDWVHSQLLQELPVILVVSCWLDPHQDLGNASLLSTMTLSHTVTAQAQASERIVHLHRVFTMTEGKLCVVVKRKSRVKEERKR